MSELSAEKSIFSLDSDDNDECNPVTDSAISKPLETSQSSNATVSDHEFCSTNNGSFESPECHEGEAVNEKNPNPSAMSAENQSTLTAFQRAKIERNRQKALLLKQARLKAHPYKRYFLP